MRRRIRRAFKNERRFKTDFTHPSWKLIISVFVLGLALCGAIWALPLK